MRHPKRWQDVDELLDAGIDVYTTLNVQHLESVNDVVERITGVKVRETLPDSVLEQADEVELVDIAPEELLERLREGKVYRPEQAERALQTFFHQGQPDGAARAGAAHDRRSASMRRCSDFRRESRRPHHVAGVRAHAGLRRPQPACRRGWCARRGGWRRACERRGSPPTSRRPRAATLSEHGPPARRPDACASPSNWGPRRSRSAARTLADEVIAYAAAHNVTKIVVGKPDRSALARCPVRLGRRRPDPPQRRHRHLRHPRATPKTRPTLARRCHRPASAGGLVAVTASGRRRHRRRHRDRLAALPSLRAGEHEHPDALSAGRAVDADRYSRGAAVLASLLGVAAFDFCLRRRRTHLHRCGSAIHLSRSW